MPVAMTGYIQSVEINDTVYVGGGTGIYEDQYIVMAYNTQSCQWHTLPPYSTRLFAMTTINNKLVSNGNGAVSMRRGNSQSVTNLGLHDEASSELL